MQKLLTFFSKNISVYAIFNDQSFNDTLANDIASFEQLGPVCAYALADLSLCWELIAEASRKHAYIISTPLNPPFI